MPEICFQIQWPDGTQETCYSPSLIVCEYLAAGSDYTLEDFVERSHTSLKIASDRVLAKYGTPCAKAETQLERIEAKAARYKHLPKPRVRLIQFTRVRF